MVNKYIILADSKSAKTFEKPRQLTEINGESIIKRTIRLLKENGIKDIVVTSHDKRFDNLGATRYEPLYNDWDNIEKTGYWLSAFPIELLNEPVVFLFGDCYYSENAIKTIVETKAKDNLFFCTYKNKNDKYIKRHDEPLAYKVVDCVTFKEHIDKVKRLKDEGKCCREPIVWELYRSINGQDINKHIMTNNYIAINDESCDIDSVRDIILLNYKLGGIKMVKCEVIKEFTLERFGELKNIERRSISTPNKLYVGDKFECSENLADYLTGNNSKNETVVKVLEIEPKIEKNVIPEEKPNEPKTEIKKSTKKKKSKK